MDQLPNELLLHIFSYLSPKLALSSIPCVNTTWKRAFVSQFPETKAILGSEHRKHILFRLHLLRYLEKRCTSCTTYFDFNDIVLHHLDAYCRSYFEHEDDSGTVKSWFQNLMGYFSKFKPKIVLDFSEFSKVIHLLVIGPGLTGKAALCETMSKGTPSNASTYQTIKVSHYESAQQIQSSVATVYYNRFPTFRQFFSLNLVQKTAADVALVCFDTTHRPSYLQAIEIAENLQSIAHNFDIILVGTLKDEHEKRQVPTEEASDRAFQMTIPYVEVSSKLYENITLLYFWAISVTLCRRVMASNRK